MMIDRWTEGPENHLNKIVHREQNFIVIEISDKGKVLFYQTANVSKFGRHEGLMQSYLVRPKFNTLTEAISSQSGESK